MKQFGWHQQDVRSATSLQQAHWFSSVKTVKTLLPQSKLRLPLYWESTLNVLYHTHSEGKRLLFTQLRYQSILIFLFLPFAQQLNCHIWHLYVHIWQTALPRSKGCVVWLITVKPPCDFLWGKEEAMQNKRGNSLSKQTPWGMPFTHPSPCGNSKPTVANNADQLHIIK